MSLQIPPENDQDCGEPLDEVVELKLRESLIQDVNRGIEQLERGEGVPFDLDQIKAKLRERLENLNR